MKRKIIIAIDGPAGAGKGSASRLLAEKLGYTYIDTGAMYRAVALIARRRGVSWDDNEGLGKIARELNFEFIRIGDKQHLHVDGEDVEDQIRSVEFGQGASIIAVQPALINSLLEQQKKFGAQGGLVMEGRNIGTAVFPNADLKIYLTATPEERARRRQLQLREKGEEIALEILIADIKDRDKRDMNREISPLKKAADATEVVTDNTALEQVVDLLEELARKAM